MDIGHIDLFSGFFKMAEGWCLKGDQFDLFTFTQLYRLYPYVFEFMNNLLGV